MTQVQGFIKVHPASCAHIADYYAQKQLDHPCIAHNLLHRGYAQWANGYIEKGTNNLFGSKRKGPTE
jgi:hypothetical protein